jgi:hypothetical protein
MIPASTTTVLVRLKTNWCRSLAPTTQSRQSGILLPMDRIGKPIATLLKPELHATTRAAIPKATAPMSYAVAAVESTLNLATPSKRIRVSIGSRRRRQNEFKFPILIPAAPLRRSTYRSFDTSTAARTLLVRIRFSCFSTMKYATAPRYPSNRFLHRPNSVW